MADAAYETVKWAKHQFWVTVGEIVALVITIGVGIAAIVVAHGSNRLARENALADRRAWLKVEASIHSGLTVLPHKPDSIEIKFQVTNIGKSPALAVSVHAKLCLAATDWPSPYVKQAEFSATIRNLHANELGHILFPHDAPWPRTIALEVHEEEIAKVREQQAFAGEDDDGSIRPFIVGCVQYLIETGGEPRQTGFAYTLQYRNLDTGQVEPFAPGVPIEMKSLLLKPISLNPGVTT